MTQKLSSRPWILRWCLLSQYDHGPASVVKHPFNAPLQPGKAEQLTTQEFL